MTIETKMNAPSGAKADARAIAAEMMAAFEALKAANDARIEEIEKRGAADPLLDAKLKKIETSLDRQRSALERLALPSATTETGSGDAELQRRNRNRSCLVLPERRHTRDAAELQHVECRRNACTDSLRRVRIRSGGDQLPASIRVPAHDEPTGHAGTRRLPETGGVDLEGDAPGDHAVKDRLQTLFENQRVVVAMRFRRIPLRQVQVPDGVEPPGLHRTLNLIEVWQKNLFQRLASKVVRENHGAIAEIVDRADDEVVLVPVAIQKAGDVVNGAVVVVHFGATQDRQPLAKRSGPCGR